MPAIGFEIIDLHAAKRAGADSTSRAEAYYTDSSDFTAFYVKAWSATIYAYTYLSL